MRRAGSVLSTWFVSYLLLMLLPLGLSAVVYVVGQRAIGAGVEHLNRSVLEQIRTATEAALQDVRRTVYQIGISRTLRLFTNPDLATGEKDPTVFVAVNDELRRIKVVSGFVEGIAIYVRNRDRIVTLDVEMEPQEFYRRANVGVLNAGAAGYQEWYRWVREWHRESVHPEDRMYTGGEIRHAVYYLQSLPLDGSDPAPATLLITLHKVAFERLLKGILSFPGGQVMVVDSRNRILFATGPYDEPPPLDYEALEHAGSPFRTTVNGETMVATVLGSTLADWRFVSLVPESVIWSSAWRLRTAMLICLALCVVLGSGAAWLFARRNYGPVRRLVRLLEPAAGAVAGRLSDEYRYLQTAVGTVLSENEQIHRRLELQDVTLRRSFLARLLKASAGMGSQYVQSGLRSFHIAFPQQAYCVLLVRPRAPSTGAPEILPAVEHLAASVPGAVVTEIEEMAACIRPIRDGELPAAIAREARRLIEVDLAARILVSASSSHLGVQDASAAYQEALGALEYQVALDDDGHVAFDEIPLGKDGYHYSITQEQTLMNRVKAGDEAGSHQLVDTVFDSPTVRSSMSMDLIKCLVFDVVATILKTLRELPGAPDPVFVQDLRVFDRLAGCARVEDMKTQIKDIIRVVCSWTREHRRDPRDEVGADVVAYVRANLGDPNLSVKTIAARFRRSPAYLSRVTRPRTTQSLSEYIADLRMETAKRLLGDRGLSVKEVALRVGYVQPAAFIRAFHKREGVSPGVYRQSSGVSV